MPLPPQLEMLLPHASSLVTVIVPGGPAGTASATLQRALHRIVFHVLWPATQTDGNVDR